MARLIFSIFLFFAFSFSVSAETWTIQRADGNARVSTDGKNWSRAKEGTELTSGTLIRTGSRGRAILGRNAERIVYRANTLAAVSVSEPSGLTTRVTQQSGSVFLSVVTKDRKSTSVITPHLAAVIKGTVLEVTTDKDGASVRVDKGIVEVRAKDRSVDVTAGRQASTGSTGLSVSAAEVTSRVPGSPNTFSLDLRAAPAGLSNAASNASANGLANGNAFAGTAASQNAGGNANGNSGGNGNGNSGGNGKGNGGGN